MLIHVGLQERRMPLLISSLVICQHFARSAIFQLNVFLTLNKLLLTLNCVAADPAKGMHCCK